MRLTVRPFYPPRPPPPQMLPYTDILRYYRTHGKEKVETRISGHWESNSEPAPAQKAAHKSTVLILAASNWIIDCIHYTAFARECMLFPRVTHTSIVLKPAHWKERNKMRTSGPRFVTPFQTEPVSIKGMPFRMACQFFLRNAFIFQWQ